MLLTPFCHEVKTVDLVAIWDHFSQQWDTSNGILSYGLSNYPHTSRSEFVDRHGLPLPTMVLLYHFF